VSAWQRLARGLGLYRIVFGCIVLFFPALIAILAVAAGARSSSLALTAMVGAPLVYFGLGVLACIALRDMTFAPRRVGGGGVLTAAFWLSLAALIIGTGAMVALTALLDVDTLRMLDFRGVGVSLVVIGLAVVGSWGLWWVGMILMLVGWRQVAAGLGHTDAMRQATVTLVAVGMWLFLNVFQGMMPRNAAVALMMLVLLLGIGLVFLVGVVRTAGSLRKRAQQLEWESGR